MIEALEAGSRRYEGKALVNSVTGEDERLEAILPIVAKHGAAVIGLANDDEIPMEPERRLEVARKIVSAAGDHGIPPEDVVIDPLAMPVGAEPRAVTLFVETLQLIRDELGVNMTCGASNTSFGLPRPAHARRGVPRRRAEPRPDERDHGRAPPADRRGRAGDRLPARPRRVGRALDRRATARSRRRRQATRRVSMPALSSSSQPDRVRLASSRHDGAVKEARVPAGTTLFDAASWNGVAIDSTCGGHGTCKKCKVRVVDGHGAGLARRPARVRDRRAEGRLAARLPRAGARGPRRRGAAAADPAEGGARRRRPARDPAARPCRSATSSSTEPTLEDQASDLERVLAAMDDVELRVPLDLLRALGAHAARADWKVTAVLCDDAAHRRRARRHDRRAASRSRSTSARRPWSRPCSTSRPASPPRCARC